MSRRNFSLIPEGRFYHLHSRKELPLMAWRIWWRVGCKRHAMSSLASIWIILHHISKGSCLSVPCCEQYVLYYTLVSEINSSYNIIVPLVQPEHPWRCFLSCLSVHCSQLSIISLSGDFSRTPSKTLNYPRLGVIFCSIYLVVKHGGLLLLPLTQGRNTTDKHISMRTLAVPFLLA